MVVLFFFSSRRRHTSCALVTGVQTCALPISVGQPFVDRQAVATRFRYLLAALVQEQLVGQVQRRLASEDAADPARQGDGIDQVLARHLVRSEERRVGKEWVSTCRSRWSP